MEEQKKKMYLSFANIITLIAVAGGGIASYATLYADVKENKTEIINLKVNEVKKDALDKESRDQVRADVKEVKQDVKDLQKDIQTILREVSKRK